MELKNDKLKKISQFKFLPETVLLFGSNSSMRTTISPGQWQPSIATPVLTQSAQKSSGVEIVAATYSGFALARAYQHMA